MDLHIVHLTKSGTGHASNLQFLGPLVFETCLRQIVFLNSDSFLSNPEYVKLVQEQGAQLEVIKGDKGYQFTLEVICGLRSLIKGETEIFGQFREFFSAHKIHVENMAMTELFKQLLTDCKWIRSQRIQNWSQNTYGSVTRKLLNNKDGVVLLGGGQLAKEIAPWLKHVKTKSILLRRPRELEPQFAGFRIDLAYDMPDAEDITVVVVAANVSNVDLEEYFKKWPNVRLVVDWRGDESLAPTESRLVFRLRDLKKDDQRSKTEEAQRIQLVTSDIQTKALEFAKKAKHNPWGWEDFCA